MASLAFTRATLASAVNNASTVVVPYPAGFVQNDLLNTTGGSLALNNNDVFPQAPSGAGTVLFTFGASDITITNNSGITWPAFSEIIVGFGQKDNAGRYETDVKVTPAPKALTTSVGTASTTIADVTGTFSQTVLNNNFRSLATELNAVTALLKKAGISA